MAEFSLDQFRASVDGVFTRHTVVTIEAYNAFSKAIDILMSPVEDLSASDQKAALAIVKLREMQMQMEKEITEVIS